MDARILDACKGGLAQHALLPGTGHIHRQVIEFIGQRRDQQIDEILHPFGSNLFEIGCTHPLGEPGEAIEAYSRGNRLRQPVIDGNGD